MQVIMDITTIQLFKKIQCDEVLCCGDIIGIAQGKIFTIDNNRATFQKVFAEYNLQNIIEKIDSIEYPDYEDIKKFFYGVK